MSTLKRKKLPTFNGVAASQTATCDLTLGQRVHVIWLELGDNGGITLASGNLIGDIRLKINGKPQRIHTGVELNAINGVNGTPYLLKTSGTAGTAAYRTYLPIYLAEPWRQNPSEISLPAWNLTGIASAQIEVDIKAVTTPVVGGFYEYDDLTGGLGGITKWIRQNFGAVGASQDFTTIDRKDFLQGIHLFPTVEGTPKFVQQVKLTKDSVAVLDEITTLQNQAVLLGRNLNPDTAAVPRFDCVIDYDDPINGALDLRDAKELTLKVTYNAAAAGNMTAMIIRAGPPE